MLFPAYRDQHQSTVRRENNKSKLMFSTKMKKTFINDICQSIRLWCELSSVNHKVSSRVSDKAVMWPNVCSDRLTCHLPIFFHLCSYLRYVIIVLTTDFSWLILKKAFIFSNLNHCVYTQCVQTLNLTFVYLYYLF